MLSVLLLLLCYSKPVLSCLKILKLYNRVCWRVKAYNQGWCTAAAKPYSSAVLNLLDREVDPEF